MSSTSGSGGKEKISRRSKKDYFVENYCLKGMSAEEAARAAGYSERIVTGRLSSILEDPYVTEKIQTLLSKDGLKDPKATTLVYKTLFDSQHAVSAAKMTPSMAKERLASIDRILKDRKLTDEMKRVALESIEKAFGTDTPNNQSRLWGASILLQVKGDNAPLKVEHSAADPLAGKSEEEQEALLKEAEKTMRLIQGGKRKSA